MCAYQHARMETSKHMHLCLMRTAILEKLGNKGQQQHAILATFEGSWSWWITVFLIDILNIVQCLQFSFNYTILPTDSISSVKSQHAASILTLLCFLAELAQIYLIKSKATVN